MPSRFVAVKSLKTGNMVRITRFMEPVNVVSVEPFNPDNPASTLVRLVYGSGADIICGANDTLEVVTPS